MIVLFSGVAHGQSGTTSNSLLFALASALKYRLKVLLVSTQSESLQLTDYLLGRQSDSQLSTATTGDLMRLASSGLLKAEAITNYSIPILKHSLLDVLVETNLTAKREQLPIFLNILQLAESSYDLIIVDSSNFLYSELDSRFIELADALILTGSQNLAVLNKLKIELAKATTPANTYVCLGKYQNQLKFKSKQVSKFLGCDKLLTVAYEAKLIDVMNDGCLLDYFGRYFFAEKMTKSNALIKSVLKSSQLLLQNLELIKE